jgi:uncharacterized protein (DUF952 family)
LTAIDIDPALSKVLYMQLIYKIEDKSKWDEALANGVYKGAPIDLADGFIHFSTARQLGETAAKHFGGREGLIVAGIDAKLLGSPLKWEVSRGGALFPHLYTVLDMKAVVRTYDLPLDENGDHVFVDEILQWD